ncbi:FKBP-type peptidyl-prolyl cis-trans isomerase [Shewanella sp. C32]|uniref:Peptidyl-prolyl cis-trans isomerase n=1 Tax=Shewanella electrica TaxID=515560 RepID=A0ABT2FFI0_9GAMM|nr:FKBP-type peptidyl-prolyl cis-trans isomerase [Shewanella electrica]MCH1925109.1 FKBP-type peptidyl-prolyl cis-trans isomerase [Shewanella electrica]MCS4554933.1 FKBP-type peptidyl-prolyl cis-trans isomerase [Shewanella electrica]
MRIVLAVIIIASVIFYFFIDRQQRVGMQETIEASQAFLKANKTQEGVITTDSGLQYQYLHHGDGTVHPQANDTVKVHYEGRLINGRVFDSSYQRNEPIEFPLNKVVKGWSEGVQLMVEGDRMRLFIPAELGYGNRAAGPIPPGSALIFDVELLKINPSAEQPAAN